MKHKNLREPQEPVASGAASSSDAGHVYTVSRSRAAIHRQGDAHADDVMLYFPVLYIYMHLSYSHPRRTLFLSLSPRLARFVSFSRGLVILTLQLEPCAQTSTPTTQSFRAIASDREKDLCGAEERESLRAERIFLRRPVHVITYSVPLHGCS